MTATSAVIVNGAVGFTGLTRAVVECKMDGSASTVTFKLPDTFIVKGVIPAVILPSGASATVALTISEGTYTATFGTTPGAGVVEIYLFGILGRRDDGPRSTSNPYAENPNTAGRP